MSFRSPTIQEIAERAGVNPSTVSRALATIPRGVSKDTVARIRELAESMGYQRNPSASALRTGNSGLLGVIVPRITDVVLAQIYEAADLSARSAGFATAVASSYDDPVIRKNVLDELLSRRVEGVLVADARLDGDEIAATLKRRRIPYVLVNRHAPGHPSVTPDDVAGGRLAARHLLEQGHEKVAVLSGLDYVSTCVERAHGFSLEYREAGIPMASDQFAAATPDAEGGYHAAKELLTRRPDTTALFAINDFSAIGAMGAARELGYSLVSDISIVGFNDVSLGAFLPVPLTTVRSRMEEIGTAGVEMLLGIRDGRGGAQLRLKPELVIRGSTAPAGKSDPEGAEILRGIPTP